MVTAAAVAGCVLGAAAPAGAAVSAATVAPRGFLPMSTSWPAPQRGIVLGYASRTAGAQPYLIETGDGGHRWRRLPAPPVPFPADNDQPDATWADGVIAVTDGTRIVATHDGGRRWSAVRLPGVPAPSATSLYISHLTIAGGRMFALVSQGGNGTGSVTVYSGRARGGVLRPVRGLSVTGGISYGDISAVGGLQVDLGSNYASERYWLSRDGVHFVPGPLPCPASTVALLGGVRKGKPSALCSGSPGDAGPGQNDKQVWTTAHPGGTFSPSGPVFVSPDQQGFAAASGQDMTIATAFDLSVTFDAGKTWTSQLGQASGAYWTDLAFPSATTGVVDCSTVDSSGNQVATVYRTTDAGHSWHALSLP
jgi:photosystem II stability/assembly factor-like uncharacterized protein